MTSLSKNEHTDKLSGICSKDNPIYHSAIKIKSIDVKSSTYIDFNKKIMIKILNLMLLTI